MTNLFVANCTKSTHLFAYMLPENPQPYGVKIAAGAQIVLKVEKDVADRILAQHIPYGAVDASKLDSEKNFSGICYQFDKPITVAKIELGLQKHDDVMFAKALHVRKVQAVATDARMSTLAQEHGVKAVAPFEVEVVEEPKSPSDPGGGFEEKITVRRQGDGFDDDGRRGRGRRNRAA